MLEMKALVQTPMQRTTTTHLQMACAVAAPGRRASGLIQVLQPHGLVVFQR